MRRQVQVVAAGGISDGRGLAASLTYGASAVWVGTRFVASVEGGAPKRHKEAIVKAGFHDTHRTLIFTGRPLRVIKNPYTEIWENERQKTIKEALSKGVVPYKVDLGVNLADIPEGGMQKQGEAMVDEPEVPEEAGGSKTLAMFRPLLAGQVSGAIQSIRPAKDILDSMVMEAKSILENCGNLIVSKL